MFTSWFSLHVPREKILFRVFWPKMRPQSSKVYITEEYIKYRLRPSRRAVRSPIWGPIKEKFLFQKLPLHFLFDFMSQLNAPFLYYIYHIPLHVSSNFMLIIRRIHCMHTLSGSLYVTLKTIEWFS